MKFQEKPVQWETSCSTPIQTDKVQLTVAFRNLAYEPKNTLQSEGWQFVSSDSSEVYTGAREKDVKWLLKFTKNSDWSGSY
jgi:hypothetical protein